MALEHEQTATDNLRRELQIEASRCEALLAQEQGQLCELRRSLEAEKGRSRELAAALRHERLLTEQLSRGARDPPAQQAPPRRSRDERARVPEPQARLEQMQQRAAELERDKEVRAVHSPGAQPPVVREPRLAAAGPPAGLECAEARPAAREGHKDSRRRVETGPGRADAELRPPGDKEKRVSARRPRRRPDSRRGAGSPLRPAGPSVRRPLVATAPWRVSWDHVGTRVPRRLCGQLWGTVPLAMSPLRRVKEAGPDLWVLRLPGDEWAPSARCPQVLSDVRCSQLLNVRVVFRG